MVSKGHSHHGFQVKVSGPDRDEFVDLAGGEVLLGRGSDADVLISHEEVSRRHLKLSLEEGKVFITDEGSRNGTFLEGSKLTPGSRQEWRPGQLLKLGMAPHQISLIVVEVNPKVVAKVPLPEFEELTPAVTPQLESLDRELAELKHERQMLKSEIESLTRARVDLELDFKREFDRVESDMESVRDRFMAQGREYVARFKKQGEMLVTEAEAKAQALREKAQAEAAEQRRLLQLELGEMRLKQMAEFKAEMNQAARHSPVRDEPRFLPEEFDLSVVNTAASGPEGQSIDEAPTVIQKISKAPRSQDRRKPGGSAQPYGGVERRGKPPKSAPPSFYRSYGRAVAGVVLALVLGVVARFVAQSVTDPRSVTLDSKTATAMEFETRALAFLTGDLGMDPGASMAIVRAEVDFMSQSGRGIASDEVAQAHENALQNLFRDRVLYERFVGFRSDFIQKKR